MLELFEHNRIAYESALSMLKGNGRAAIVHPTGTGKSFIGFKLAEDNPQAVVCWLSPSEYIFKTQIENLKAAGSAQPNNISFFTYAKLMMMDAAAIEDIRPDYIVLDEFHRCGAQMWGDGVQRLLAAYPQAPVLGLSATNIRYLDNQRDSAIWQTNSSTATSPRRGDRARHSRPANLCHIHLLMRERFGKIP